MKTQQEINSRCNGLSKDLRKEMKSIKSDKHEPPHEKSIVIRNMPNVGESGLTHRSTRYDTKEHISEVLRKKRSIRDTYTHPIYIQVAKSPRELRINYDG